MVNLRWSVVDDNPIAVEAFIFASFASRRDANDFLKLCKGLRCDSYSCQHYRVMLTKAALRLEEKYSKLRKDNE